MVAHSWSFCSTCRCAMVHCGHCGNNCCNAGSGDNCPDKCESAYALQATGAAPEELKERERVERAAWKAMTPEQRDAVINKRFDGVLGSD